MFICFLTYRMKKWKNVCFFRIRVEIEKYFSYVKHTICDQYWDAYEPGFLPLLAISVFTRR